MEGVRQARLVAVLARKILAWQEARQSVWKDTAPYLRRVGREARRLANARQGTRPVRRRQAAAVPGSGPTHTERMERHPGRALPQGSRQVLGGEPRPRIVVRATRGREATHGEPDAGNLARPVRSGG